MSIQTIENTQQLHEHIMALIVIEPRFLPIYEQVGIPSLRHNVGGFEQLMRAMVGQQLSVAAAASIWQRLLDAALTNPQAIIKATDEDLRAQGLSKQKTRYIRSLVDHDIDFAALEIMLDEEAIEVLTAVTINPACAIGLGEKVGTAEVGKQALRHVCKRTLIFCELKVHDFSP